MAAMARARSRLAADKCLLHGPDGGAVDRSRVWRLLHVCFDSRPDTNGLKSLFWTERHGGSRAATLTSLVALQRRGFFR